MLSPQSAAHLSPGRLCEGLGHPLQLLQHNPQVLLLIRPLRSTLAARIRLLRQREQKLKDGPHFLLHLGGTGQKEGVRGISLQPQHGGNRWEEALGYRA